MPKIVTKMMILVLRARQKQTRTFATRFAVVVLFRSVAVAKETTTNGDRKEVHYSET